MTGTRILAACTPAAMQRDLPAEDCGRTIARIVVQERAAAEQFILEIRQPCTGRLLPFVVAAAHRERDAIARGHDDRRRPQFDVERDDLAGLERLLFVVGVIRPVFGGQLRIELAVRGAQPALGNGRVRIDRAHEHDLLQVGRVDAEHDEQVGIGGRRRHEQSCRQRPGDFGVAVSSGGAMKVTPAPVASYVTAPAARPAPPQADGRRDRGDNASTACASMAIRVRDARRSGRHAAPAAALWAADPSRCVRP